MGISHRIVALVPAPDKRPAHYLGGLMQAMRLLKELRIDVLGVTFAYWRPAEVLAARLLVDPVRRMDVIRALSTAQGQIYNCHFTEIGTQGWTIY